MKKLTSSKSLSPRKLALRAETIGILRGLTSRELQHHRVAGATAGLCNDSPATIFTDPFGVCG